jgi:hypothetical protein
MTEKPEITRNESGKIVQQSKVGGLERIVRDQSGDAVRNQKGEIVRTAPGANRETTKGEKKA